MRIEQSAGRLEGGGLDIKGINPPAWSERGKKKGVPALSHRKIDIDPFRVGGLGKTLLGQL